MSGVKPTVEEIAVGTSPETWRTAGFEVAEDGTCVVGTVRLRLSGRAGDELSGIQAWTLRGAGSGELDGLPTALAKPGEENQRERPDGHPNGAVQIDHVVVFTEDLERTTAAFEGAGISRRRVREVEVEGKPLRQGFFRLGEVIGEVVQHANVLAGPARFWGITFTVADLDATAELLGDDLGSIRDAVQPGRRIATVRGHAGLGLPVAFITPENPAA